MGQLSASNLYVDFCFLLHAVLFAVFRSCSTFWKSALANSKSLTANRASPRRKRPFSLLLSNSRA
ncbi:hypothetical protein E2320_007910 [Naja naja]|nr:hypothetical protein E2320_007910 [Naja naja]